MKALIESLSPVQKKINIEVPSERVQEELEKTYRTFQRSAQVKGFRAGKVPRSVLERQYGEQVAAEVSSYLVEETYWQALQEHSLQVVTDPQLVTEKLTPGQPFRYSATVEVRPEVTVANYEGLDVEKHTSKVAEEEVNNTLTRLTENFAQLHPLTDRDRVENGDVVTIDYSASLGGRPLAGLQGNGRLVETGKDAIFPGFQERLIGAQKGETLQFSLPMPQRGDEPAAESPTTERIVAFRVTINDLARKEVPALDDEFAKDHGECDTLDELREKVRQNLQKAADQRSENQMQDALITRLLETNTFEVPPSLVREQMRRMLVETRVVRPNADGSINEAGIPDNIREEFFKQARKQVQSIFLLDALAKQVNLAVSDEEIQQQIAEVTASVGVERQGQVDAYYAKEENKRLLRNRLLHDKALRFVVEKAAVKIVEGDVAAIEEKD
ncbi:MAG: trigger factor [Deltaproteobacteria bacterium]|nr:trigger factor [Deltaproteobacteria bacterium]